MAIESGRLYDYTGTLVPVKDAPPPPPGGFVPVDGLDYGPTDRYRGYLSRNLTPARIERVLEAADIGEPHDFVELAEEMVEKDLKLQSVAGTRRKAVLGINHEIRPVKLDDDAAADQPLADEIGKFCNAAVQPILRDLVGHMSDSVGYGIAVDWIDWGRDRNGKIVPVRVRKVPTKHLRWGRTSDTVRVWEPSNPMAGQTGDIGRELEPFTTVRMLSEERADHPARSGLFRTCAWFYLFKNVSIKDWVSAADRYGIPSRILTLNADDFKNPTMYERARAAVRSIGSNLSGVISDQWKLDLAAAMSKGSAELFSFLIEAVDKAFAQLWLGHELTSQGSAGGGMLGISAAIQVRQDYLEADCNAYSCTIRRDLLTPMVGWNYGWDKLHLVPNSIFDFEPPQDLTAMANVESTVAKTYPGLTRSIQQLRDVYGIDEPLDDADSITAGSAASLMGGGVNPGANPGGPIRPPGPEKPPAPEKPVVNGWDPDLEGIARIEPVLYSRRPRGRTVTKPSAARLSKVDKVAARAAAAITVETEKWKAQLRTMIREATKEGLTLPELKNRIVAAYPDLDASMTEKILHEQMLLVRLFGRNA